MSEHTKKDRLIERLTDALTEARDYLQAEHEPTEEQAEGWRYFVNGGAYCWRDNGRVCEVWTMGGSGWDNDSFFKPGTLPTDGTTELTKSEAVERFGREILDKPEPGIYLNGKKVHTYGPCRPCEGSGIVGHRAEGKLEIDDCPKCEGTGKASHEESPSGFYKCGSCEKLLEITGTPDADVICRECERKLGELIEQKTKDESSHARALRELDLKPGDRVRVERKVDDYDGGWDNSWINYGDVEDGDHSMDHAVGQVGTVARVTDPEGVEVDIPGFEEDYTFPAHALTLVSRAGEADTRSKGVVDAEREELRDLRAKVTRLEGELYELEDLRDGIGATQDEDGEWLVPYYKPDGSHSLIPIALCIEARRSVAKHIGALTASQAQEAK